jgi:hypothetical protein
LPSVIAFPLPGTGVASVAVPAPAAGSGNWVGAPSAALDDDGGVVVAYRVRTADQRGTTVVVGYADDSGRLTPVAKLGKDRFVAESLERPALVRAANGRWRLYVSCATPGTKHWHIDAVEADDPLGLAHAAALPVFPGDETTAVKDPVIRRGVSGWQAWICCHPLDVPGDEDRMYTRWARSGDGLDWQWGPVALAGRAGHWDARGARVTAVLPDGRASYDGRASKHENFAERTGLAVSAGRGTFTAWGVDPISEARYLDVIPLPNGRHRIYYEAPLADGSHELRTELLSAPRNDP